MENQANVIARAIPSHFGCQTDRIRSSADGPARGRGIHSIKGATAMTVLTRRSLLGGAAAITAASAMNDAGAFRRADGRQAGAELLPLQGRRLRGDGAERRHRAQRHAGEHGGQQDAAGYPEGARRCVPADRPRHQPVQYSGGEHRQQSCAARLRLRRQRRADRRQSSEQHECRRHRSEEHRYRSGQPFPRRPHLRHPRESRRRQFPECRDHGAGGGVEILERRQPGGERHTRRSSRVSPT